MTPDTAKSKKKINKSSFWRWSYDYLFFDILIIIPSNCVGVKDGFFSEYKSPDFLRIFLIFS